MKGMNNMHTFLAVKKKNPLRGSRTYIILLILTARLSGNYSGTFESPSESLEQEGGRRGGGGCILGSRLTHCSFLNLCVAHLITVASFFFFDLQSCFKLSHSQHSLSSLVKCDQPSYLVEAESSRPFLTVDEAACCLG